MSRFNEVKVAVGIPSNGMWYTDFAICYCNLVLYFYQHRVEGAKKQSLHTNSSKGSMLPKQRMETVKWALENNMTHLLWIDADHTFPRNLIHRLLHHDKDVIGVNHVVKRVPSNPTARRKSNKLLEGEVVYTDPDSPELEPVWRLGCGTMMVNMDVYRKTGFGIFDMFYRPELQTYQGEDWSMCEAIEKAGYEIWVDHVLSEQCTHIGVYNYDHNVVGHKVREEIPAEESRVVLADA